MTPAALFTAVARLRTAVGRESLPDGSTRRFWEAVIDGERPTDAPDGYEFCVLPARS